VSDSNSAKKFNKAVASRVTNFSQYGELARVQIRRFSLKPIKSCFSIVAL